MTPIVPGVVTHYHRPFSRPLLSLTALPEGEVGEVLKRLAEHEPLPYRLEQPGYLPQRRGIEARMRAQLLRKGGRAEREHPHYFVLGEFSLWEADGSRKLQLPLSELPPACVSFTLTDSFFNYRSHNLRGVAIPPRPYHGELFTTDELPGQVERYGLPGDAWRTDPARRFEVYIEVQLWSDAPLDRLLGEGR